MEQEVLFKLYEECDEVGSNLTEIVGFLENILVDEAFTAIQNEFCSKYASKLFILFISNSNFIII